LAQNEVRLAALKPVFRQPQLLVISMSSILSEADLAVTRPTYQHFARTTLICETRNRENTLACNRLTRAGRPSRR
jgi:hypothetical protein